MGAKDSSAQLERIFRDKVIFSVMNHVYLKDLDFTIEFYRDNLYIAVNSRHLND
jgi:hypothetical protein